MKKISLIFVSLSIIILSSCNNSENIKYLSGYWEIYSVKKDNKIRPMNTSCMPFISKEATYTGANSICEKKGDVWVNLNGLPCQTLATSKSASSILINASGDYEEEVKIYVRRIVGGKRIVRRAHSMIVLKSCNNDL